MKLSTCCYAPEHTLNGFCSDCKEHCDFEEEYEQCEADELSDNDKHGVNTDADKWGES